LRAKLAAARQQCWTDVAFWGGVVPGNVRDLLALHEAGVRGFKCFLAPSGVAEFPHVQERDLRQAMPALTEIGAPLLVHAELPDLLNSDGGDPVRYRDYLQTRPPAAEEEAIALMIRLCREFRTRVHIVHLASSGALAMLRAAKDEGLPITVETCPHYLHFAAETIPDRATEFKCAPPIREGQHGEALWSALTSGLIDFIATDHSPCPPELKLPESGDFLRAWGGIASLGLALPVIWTGARRRGLGLEDVARWLSTAPARLARLDHKGMIAAGYDADFVIWAPEAALEVRNYHRLTPYNGQQLSGVVQSTWLHGRRIFDRGRLVLEPPGTTCTN
jgi:allantoinase